MSKKQKKNFIDAPIVSQEKPCEIGCLTCTRSTMADSSSVKIEENRQASDVLRRHFWFTEVDFHEARICLICWDQVNQFHKFYVSVEELHQSRLASVIIKSEREVPENDCLEECSPEQSDRELVVEPQEQEDSIIFKEEPALEIIDELESDNEQSSDETETRQRPKKRKLALKSMEMIEMEDDYIAQHFKFTCKQCGDSSPSFELFSKHCINAHGEKYPTVECCGQLFNRKNRLYEHVQYINNPHIFRCEPCRRSFSYKYGLIRHQKMVHASIEEMKFKCEWCPRSFTMRSPWIHHMKNHYLRFHCTECPIKFDKAQLLVDHVTEVHPGISPYKCPFCEKTFYTYVKLHKHERAMHPEEWRQAEKNSKPPAATNVSLPEVIESKLRDAEKASQLEDACIGEHVKFSCKLCAENFPNFTQYVYHCEDEHGDKSPSIDCCGKQFTRKSQLYEHVRVTKNPDLLRCKMCPKSFTSLIKIDQHMKGVHASKEERKYKCDRCPRAFVQKGQFNYHYKRHLAQKEGEQKLKYPCNKCPSIFSTGRYLKDHILADHPGIVPYQCPFCNASFKLINSFAGHVTGIHPKKLDQVAKAQECRLTLAVLEGDEKANDNPVKLSNGVLGDTSQQQETTISQEDETDLSTDDESDADGVPSGVDIKTEHLPNTHQLEDDLIREHVNFTCKQCEVVSECFAAYLRHSLETHGNDLKFIECCGKQYYQRGHLYDHVCDVHKPVVLSCKLCDQKFGHNHVFLKHMKQVHAIKQEHLKDNHGTKKGQKYKCDQCPQTFTLLPRYKNHMKCHLVEKRIRSKLSYPCTCADCPATFSSGELFKRHVSSVHPGSGPYSCPFCKRTMIKLSNFRIHLETLHLNEIICKQTSSDGEILEETHSETAESTLEVTNQQQESDNIVQEKSVLATADGYLQNNYRRKKKTIEQMRLEDEIIGKHAKFICKVCGVDSLNFSRHMQHALRGHDNSYAFVQCCGKQFYARQLLLEHVQVTNNPDIFRCQVCEKNFSNRSGFEGHIKTFHSSDEEKKLKCDQCPDSFALRKQLRYHVKRRHGLADADPMLSYPCADCPTVFDSVDTFKEHLSSVHPGTIPFNCPFCPRSFRLARGIALHAVTTHPNELHEYRRSSKQPPTTAKIPEESEPEVSDSAADEIYNEEEEVLPFPNKTMDDYIRQHNKFTCKQCGEDSPSFEMYFKHALEAHSNKLTSIECCGKQFYYRFRLYRHVQLINNPNMLRCKLCRRTFAEKYAFEAHMKGQHASKEEMKYKCDLCPTSFALVKQYRRHLAHHEIPEDVMLTLKYPCAECPRKFSNGNLLRAHTYDLHSRLNLHKCPYCKRSFKGKLYMQNHIMAAHLHLVQNQ